VNNPGVQDQNIRSYRSDAIAVSGDEILSTTRNLGKL